jgi:hypothetical protein
MKHIGFLAKVVKIYQLPHLRLGIFDQVLGMHLVYSHSYNKIFSQLHWSHMLITYKSVARLLYPCQSVVVDLNLRQVWHFFFYIMWQVSHATKHAQFYPSTRAFSTVQGSIYIFTQN